jgi:hypothetical protein
MEKGRMAISLLVLFTVSNGAGVSSAAGKGQSHPVEQGPVTRELGAMVAQKAPVQLATIPVTVRIALNKDATTQIASALKPYSKAKLALSLSGIDFDRTPEVHYQVYLDLPKNEEPNYKSIYFVGNLAFFGFQPHAGTPEHPPVINFDITPTIRELIARKLWNNSEASVTFVVQWLVDENDRPLPVPPGVRLHFTSAKITAIAPPGST